MYDVVINKEDATTFLSVFDKRGNEIFNVSNEEAYVVFQKLKEQKFKICEYITSFTHKGVLYLVYSSLVPDQVINPEDVSIAAGNDAPIANESFTGFGLNRYVHRQFLKVAR